MDKNYDIIVLGTGLKEYILLSLLIKYPKIKKISLKAEDLKICQINKSKIIGESCPSLNISQLFQKFGKIFSPEKYGEDKDWNIDLIPKIMLRNSPIIKLFLITDIYNYIEWKTIEQVYVYQYDKGGMFSSPKGVIYKIPQNQEEVWGSDILGIFEKNRCKKFYNYISNLIFGENNVIRNTENIDINNISFKELGNKFGLEDNTLDFIGHAVALYSDDNFLQKKAIDGIRRVKFYMENLLIKTDKNNTTIQYYSTPFIYPIWGFQKIYKNYEREMYLYDYKYLQENDIEEILYDEENQFKGIKTIKGEKIYGKILLSCPEYMLKFNKVEKKNKIIRRIIISPIPIPCSNLVDSCQLIIPKMQTGQKNDIFILQLSYGHCISKKGYYVIFLSCWDDGRDINLQLKPAMDVFGFDKDMIEIFDMNCDYYEPINKNFDDNVFISNSFLPQSHFEDDYEDITYEFQKITEAKLQFDKLKNSN